MPFIATSVMPDEASGTNFTVQWPNFTEDIARGIEFLDEVAPGWETKINPETLKLEDTEACICGQVFSDHYTEGVGLLHSQGGFADEWSHDAVYYLGSTNYGFNIPTPEMLDEVSENEMPAEARRTYRKAAVDLDDWAHHYIIQHDPSADPDSMDRAAVLWSSLTEQWIRAINARAGEPVPATV